MVPEDECNNDKMMSPSCVRVERTDSQMYTVPNTNYLSVDLPRATRAASDHDSTPTASITNPGEKLQTDNLTQFDNVTSQQHWLQTSPLCNEFEEEKNRGTANKSSVQILSYSSTDNKLEATTQCHESPFPEYAVVVKNKKEAKSSIWQQDENSSNMAASAKRSQSSGYDICMKQHKPSKATASTKEHPTHEANKRSPTPEYAKLATKQEPQMVTGSLEKKPEDHPTEKAQRKSPTPEYAKVAKEVKNQEPTIIIESVEKQKDLTTERAQEKSPSPEYAEVAKVNKSSTKSTNHENEGSEQHYYHSLENPEQSVDGDKEKKESIEAINHGELKYSLSQSHHVVSDDMFITQSISPHSGFASDGEVAVT